LTLKFRKRNDAWVCVGPVSELRLGEVTVTQKNGRQVPFEVAEISAPFKGDDGTPWAFGYETPRAVKENGPAGIPDSKPCMHCAKVFSYGDCKERGGNWKEGYCGC
jgi:hypothetical protein